MKFKTFISTLILFQIFFYAGFLFVSMYMMNNQISAARERGIGEHYLIASSFGKDLAAVSNRRGSLEESIRSLFDFYTEHYSRRNVFMEINKDGELVTAVNEAGEAVPLTKHNLFDIRVTDEYGKEIIVSITDNTKELYEIYNADAIPPADLERNAQVRAEMGYK